MPLASEWVHCSKLMHLACICLAQDKASVSFRFTKIFMLEEYTCNWDYCIQMQEWRVIYTHLGKLLTWSHNSLGQLDKSIQHLKIMNWCYRCICQELDIYVPRGVQPHLYASVLDIYSCMKRKYRWLFLCCVPQLIPRMKSNHYDNYDLMV